MQSEQKKALGIDPISLGVCARVTEMCVSAEFFYCFSSSLKAHLTTIHCKPLLV